MLVRSWRKQNLMEGIVNFVAVILFLKNIKIAVNVFDG